MGFSHLGHRIFFLLFFSFVEYKSLCDGLRKEQIEWFARNDKLPIIIVHSLKKIKVNDLKKFQRRKT